MTTRKITSKGQVTIPKKIREILNVDTSDKIEFIPIENGKVMISRKRHTAKELFGMLKHRKQTKTVSIEEMQAAIENRRLKRSLS